MDRFEVARVLKEMAFLLEFKEERSFRSLAYARAARVLEHADAFEVLVQKNQLTSLPGIGPSISKMIEELLSRGSLSYYEKLKSEFPETLFELQGVPTLSIQKVKQLYLQYGISSLEELKSALQEGRLDLEFTPKAKEHLLHLLETLKSGKTILWEKSWHIALSFLEKLKKLTSQVEVVGEVRRFLEGVHHIEFLAIHENTEQLISAFTKHSFIKEVVEQGELEVTVLLKQGISASLRIVAKEGFAYELWMRTGSDAHCKEFKVEAKKCRVSIAHLKKMQSETELYALIKVPFIVPELREGYGEIESGKNKQLPHLIEITDLKGALHCHTEASDGRNSLEEMVLGAIELGWEYIGISDHSKSSHQAGGLNERDLLQQNKEIQLRQKKYPSIHIFSGVECDILKEGELDFEDRILKKLDFVIVSVHRYFSMEKHLMTARIIKAIENPYSTVIGHLTGRLIGSRSPYEVDVYKVINACAIHGKAIELNAYPDRLDMDWRYWKYAKEKGVKCFINPDAHSVRDLQNCLYGIQVARKGWLEKEDVMNTRSLKEIKTYLKRK